MTTVQLKPLLHRRGEPIGIYFSKDGQLNVTLKQVKGIKWSQTHRCWYMSLNKESFLLIKAALKEVVTSSSTTWHL
ncbi:MAG: hypothetical protein C4329_13690 [Chitinophagaceae bacterium]